MIIDFAAGAVGVDLNADIVIIGSGIAGLVIAREMAASGKQVLVLESGDISKSLAADAAAKGLTHIIKPDGEVLQQDHYLHESRQFAFGGAANKWGGKCAIMDPVDFKARSYMPMSGWPVDYQTLVPHVEKACRDMQIPTLTKADDWARADFSINNRYNFESSIRTFTPLTGEDTGSDYDRFKRGIATRPNIRMLINATVKEIVTNRSGDKHIDYVCIESADGEQHQVSGTTFILAAGGLENVRLLLSSNRQFPQGLGNDHGLVGRYFCGHAIFRLPSSVPGRQAGLCLPLAKDSLLLKEYVNKDSSTPHKLFKLSENAQRRKKLPNGTITLERRLESDGQVFYPAFFMLEQQLTEQSYVSLLPPVNGHSALQLHWHFSRQDVINLQAMLALFDADLQKSELGYLDYVFDETALFKYMTLASHHMGTTRMSDQPDKGVVDQYCRLHGSDNLYIASTSVFCTSALANPTITLLALCHRICTHIKD
ncbi:FAD-dependent oxidoreductase [Rheinheimera sp. SA_1]|uniref:FAD-dependent oxidoreductase n=1 Tax=Rheinheimera sp. SA_1 TaxID=1827365 RepID=UPI000B0AB3A7|nr:GMC family oxidoreductase [Rheinheimera sp. SA_1]